MQSACWLGPGTRMTPSKSFKTYYTSTPEIEAGGGRFAFFR